MGKVFKYGDHVDTDVIIPARFLNVSDPITLAQHCMVDLDTTFHEVVSPGDVIVAGDNFGCGSSREHAPIAIKASGIQCVIAKSFARIFFRNAFNIGLPLIESEAIVRECQPGDELRINLTRGQVDNLTQNKSYPIEPLPAFMQSIIDAGGLVAYTREVQDV